MRLHIVTPLTVVVDMDIQSLRAEDDSGSFGILPGHADFLTRLSVSVVSWRSDGVAHFCALRGGVLTVAGGTTVSIATREAVPGDDLEHLDQTVLARFRADLEEERSAHTEATRLQISAIRQLIRRLKPGQGMESLR